MQSFKQRSEMISDAKNFLLETLPKYFFYYFPKFFFSCNKKYFLILRKKILCQEKNSCHKKKNVLPLRMTFLALQNVFVGDFVWVIASPLKFPPPLFRFHITSFFLALRNIFLLREENSCAKKKILSIRNKMFSLYQE